MKKFLFKKEITNYMNSERGATSLLAVIGAVLATTAIIYPIAQWQATMSNNNTISQEKINNSIYFLIKKY